MNFEPSEDARAFADTAQALFADYCGDEQLRSFDAGGAPYMEDLWRQCVAAGLHTIVVPEAEGGLGLGMEELCCVLEQQGAALALVPLWEHQLALAAVLEFGLPAAREKVLAGAPERDLLALSLASLYAARGPSLRAVRIERGFRISGCAAAVPLGAHAARALLAVDLEGAPRLLLVDLGNPAIERIPGTTQHHLAVADLVFDAFEVGVEGLLAEAALGWLEPRAIACLGALQLGVSTRQLARTVEYVAERRQFERVIGSFQLVAAQMADGQIAVEALRSLLAQLVYRLDAGQGVMPQAWSTRTLACEAGHRVGHAAQHVHGGIGVDTSFHIHRYLFWSRALGLALGGTAQNLAKLGDWLADHNTLGWKYDLPEDQAV